MPGYMRSFHHRPAKREAVDAEVPVRSKRSFSMIPDPYDDVIRSDWHHRSWKRHRATQYRPIDYPQEAAA